MRIPRPTPWGSGSVIAGLTLALAFAACSDTTGPAPNAVPGDLAFQVGEVDSGEIEVCKDGPAGTYSFEASVTNGPAGTFPLGTSFDIDAGECAVIFTTDASGPGSVSTVEITETALPADVAFDRTEVVAPDFPATEGTFGNPVSADANLHHGSLVTFFNVADHDDCVGLTPGFWRNWANHYTQEEFESLLAATSFAGTSVEDATAILSYGGPDPVERLRKFVLANELTLALTADSDLPNPDDASLSLDCEDPESGMSLGDALAAAADILADPGSFNRGEINAVKDALDNIANLPVEEEE